MAKRSYPSARERLKTRVSPPVTSLRERNRHCDSDGTERHSGQEVRTHQGPQFEMVLKMKSIFFLHVHVVHMGTHVYAGTYMCVMCTGALMTSYGCVSQWLSYIGGTLQCRSLLIPANLTVQLAPSMHSSLQLAL